MHNSKLKSAHVTHLINGNPLYNLCKYTVSTGLFFQVYGVALCRNQDPEYRPYCNYETFFFLDLMYRVQGLKWRRAAYAMYLDRTRYCVPMISGSTGFRSNGDCCSSVRCIGL